jgi:hypothetical protein
MLKKALFSIGELNALGLMGFMPFLQKVLAFFAC